MQVRVFKHSYVVNLGPSEIKAEVDKIIIVSIEKRRQR
jgi:hypothetical protein